MPVVFLISLVVFFEGLAFGAILPVLTKYSGQFGGGPAIAGLMFAFLTAPRAIMNPLWGRLSDRWGRRHVLIIVGLGSISASLIWAFAPQLDGVLVSGLTWLLASRVLGGLCGAQAALSFAVAADVTKPEKRAAAMGLLGAAFGLAFTAGPAFGGLIAERASPASVGYFCAISQTLSLATIITLLPETGTRRARTEIAIPLTTLITRQRTAVLLITVLAMTIGYAVLIPTFQPLTETWYGFSVEQAGYALAALGLVGVFTQGGLVRPAVSRLGERPTAMIGLVLLAFGMGTIATNIGLIGLWIGLVLCGVGLGLATPAITGLISLEVTAAEQGAMQGLNQSATSLGRAAGYLVGGAAFAMAAWTPYAIGAVTALLAAGWMLIVVAPPRPALHDAAGGDAEPGR
jgi:DHA1 family tetracycline resistance protein-like MFS transporter